MKENTAMDREGQYADNSDVYAAIRAKTIRRIMQITLWFGAPALILSLSRYSEFGWLPVMGVHLVAYGVLCALYLLRNHLSDVFVSYVIVAAVVGVALGGYAELGKASGGNFYSLCAVVIAVSLLGRRAGLVTLASIVLIQLACGIAFTQGIWSVDVDLNAYNASAAAWVTNIASIVFALMLVAIMQEQRIAIDSIMGQLNAKTLEAETASQYKSTFLATISHELRTPLNGIIGLSNMLRETPLDEKQRGHVDLLSESGHHLVELLGNTLDMSKIESGSMEVHSARFQIGRLIETTMGSLSYMAQENGVRLALHNNLPAPAAYVGDSPKVRQIVYNLLGNAIKFTRYGSVEIIMSEVDAAESGLATGNSVVRIVVKDEGEGIPADQLETVFEPFSQINGQAARIVPGTGLGLTITKQLVELLGGRIEVESTLGKGTAFSVYIPLLRDAAEGAADTANDEPTTESLRVLIAEDNAVNALILTNMLTKLNHSVEHVEDGAKAVARALDGDIDIVFMDVHMPFLNGVEATKQIRQKYSAVELPIIGATAGAFDDQHSECVGAGMNDVLVKPFPKERLLSILSSCRRHK